MTPTLSELTRTFARIGILSFGGPAAQIALMHREVVDDRRWLDEKDYLSALSFCMLLPGPEAMQLATWIGWRTHGVIGGLITGLLFVLPGAAVVLALSMIYAAFGQVPLVGALFFGIQAAVVVVVIEALLRVAKRALKGRAQWVIAGLAFLGLFAFNMPFPAIIGAAALWGFATTRPVTATGHPAATKAPPAALRQSLQAIVIWGAVWLVPLGLLTWLDGGLLADLAAFFSKLAVLTFGGAYAVLAWMTQEVVQDRAWLTLPEMMTGLGLAETTPGPLILVTEFVGYMAAFKQGGIWYGIAGAVVTVWMTFAPCFLWIFAGAPWLGRITAMPRLSGALSAITAAVVGVIANLSLWFATHVFFGRVTMLEAGPLHMILPDVTTLHLPAVVIAALAGWLLLFRHWNLIAVLAIAAASGALALMI
jgi:chromate transporter